MKQQKIFVFYPSEQYSEKALTELLNAGWIIILGNTVSSMGCDDRIVYVLELN